MTRNRTRLTDTEARAAEMRKSLKRKYEEIKQQRTAKSTKAGYRRLQRVFCERFMKKYFPEVALAHSVNSFLRTPACAQHLQNKELMDGEHVVLLFLQALPEFCVKEDKDLGNSTFASARAAVRDLFKEAGYLWADKSQFANEISDWCRGKARTIAEYRLSGATSATVGKRHMYFDLYKVLAEEYFNAGLLFEWAYHVLTWNLMTRGCSTAALRWTHMQSANDNIVCVVPKSKADQEGVKLDPKHMYVNVLNPYLCPVYALGVYTLCLRNQHYLDVFPGGAQLSRFSKALNRQKSSNVRIIDMLNAYGYSAQDIGVHSIRKGAASYAANGIVAQTPSISAICLRAGWTQGAIKDTYLKYEHAQDTYLGRVLAGYPLTGVLETILKFSSLPPCWGKNINHVAVKEAMKVAYPCTLHPSFPKQSMGLFNRLLAVVVKNDWWVKNVVLTKIDSNDHPILSTDFYLQGIPEKIVHLLDEDPTLMVPTGTPFFLSLLENNDQLLKKVLEIINVHIPAAVNETVNRVDKLLEEKGVRAGNATMGEIKKMFTEKFENLERKLTNEFNLIDRTATTPSETVTTCNRIPCRKIGLTAWYQWQYPNGKWYGIPPNTQYPNPKTGLGPLISQFYHGRSVTSIEGDRSIMPICKMGPQDVPPNTKKDLQRGIKTTRARSRLSEAKQFVKFLRSNIENNIDEEERGYSIPPRLQDCYKMAEHAHVVLAHCAPRRLTPAQKQRKTCNQKGWTTHLNHLRRWKRESGLGGLLSEVTVDNIEFEILERID